MHIKIAQVLATLSVEELNQSLIRHDNAVTKIMAVDVHDDHVQYTVEFQKELDSEVHGMQPHLEPNQGYLVVSTTHEGKIDVSF